MLCETGSLNDLKRQGYVAETKWDGTRVVIVKEGNAVTLWNRDGINYTARLPEIVQAAKRIPGDFHMDGEAVYINPKTGEAEFTPCQRRCASQDLAKILWLQAQFPITFMAFDIPKLGEHDLQDKPYLNRKRILHELLEKFSLPQIRYVPHRLDLAAFWEEVKQRQEEGLILKRVDSKYENERSFSWLKIKNWRPPEVCDVIGYTLGRNARAPFFASLVLVRDGRYRGQVGTGFNDWQLIHISQILRDCPRILRPFEIGEPYTAVKTDLKVEVTYYKTTEAGVMRWPVFLRIA